MHAPRIAFAACLLLVVPACGRKGAAGVAAPPASAAEAFQTQLESLGYLGESTGRTSTSVSASLAAPAAEAQRPAAREQGEQFWASQKLIRNGLIELEVEEVDVAAARIEEIARARGGVVAGSEFRRHGDKRRSGALTLRVPAAAYDATLAALREVGEVVSEHNATEDVTKAYSDLETRLAIKRQTEERLRRLLATREGPLADLLHVERELERVVTEIEQMLGQKRFWDQRIAISTIQVTLREPGQFVAPGAFAPVKQAMSDSVRYFAGSLAALIFFVVAALPWAIALLLLVMLLRSVLKRRRARSES